MTRLGRALLALALAAAAAAVPAAAQTPRAERPTYAIGDTWALADATYRLARIERGGTYVFVADGDREIHLTRNLAIAFVKRGAETIEFTPPPRPTWPLEAGKWGTAVSSVRFQGAVSGDIPVQTTWRIQGYEDVDAGGRALKAFRILYSVTPEIAGRFNYSPRQTYGPTLVSAAYFDATVWYAPDAQRIVKAASSKSLLTFELGGPPSVAAQPPPPAPAPAAPPRPEPPRRETARPEPPRPDAGAPARPAAPAPGAALTVSVSSPADQARVEHDTASLAGLVTSGRGVSRVVVTLNGVEVTRIEERTPRPGVSLSASLKLQEGANLLVVAATDADGAVQQDVRTIHYQKAAPLTISVRHPAEGLRVTAPETVVAAVVTSSRGVGSVTVTLNGTEVLRQAESTPPRSVVVTAPVTLREGANTIVLTAREPDGTVRQEVRTVLLDRPSAPTPAPPAPTVRESWAVVIGVGRYDNPGIPALRYAVADAETMYETLTRSAGFKQDHVLLLTDRSERKPTLRNIKWALGTFLARSARQDDTVIVYYAGHGAPEVDPRGIERDGLAKYLIPSDADPDDLFSTALPMDDLQTIFARIEAERVVAFIDACYSGAAGGRTFASKKTRATSVDDLFLERLTRSKGRVIVTAARPAEVSIELPDLGHGVFTYFLSEGLRGAADLNRDGIVSLQELYEYVEQQVVRKSRAVGGNQHPMMKGEVEGILPLAKVRVR